MKIKFKTIMILLFCGALHSILAGTSQAETLKEEDKLIPKPPDLCEASRLINQIAGVYIYHFHRIDGPVNTYTSDDILEIVKVNENTIYFRTRLHFDYGHTCSLFGVASYTKDKSFLFKGNKELGECSLKIVPSKKKITLIDGADGGKPCRDNCCGVRGVFGWRIF